MDYKRTENNELIIDFSVPESTVVLSSEQSKIVSTQGNVLVKGCPGAGKTEVCIWRYGENDKQNKRTLVLIFSRAARGELRRRFPYSESYTIHSYCYQHLGQFKSYPELLYKFILSKDKEFFDEIIVDELQDLSPLELDVVRSIPHNTIFAVGDANQSIYIGDWARSIYDSPAMGKKIFTKLEKFCTTVELTENRRSSSTIVNTLTKLAPSGMVALGPKKLTSSAIFTRTHKEEKAISIKLTSLGYSHRVWNNKDVDNSHFVVVGENPKIDLMVTHGGKGRQYRNSIVMDWFGALEEDFNLLYVAISRAAERSFLVGKKEMSLRFPFIEKASLEEALKEVTVC
jgi:superfamily I DNA/RNA helicase